MEGSTIRGRTKHLVCSDGPPKSIHNSYSDVIEYARQSQSDFTYNRISGVFFLAPKIEDTARSEGFGCSDLIVERKMRFFSRGDAKHQEEEIKKRFKL